MKKITKDKSDHSVDETKRDSLKKMGKKAAYISPVVLTLLTSNKASALSPPPPP